MAGALPLSTPSKGAASNRPAHLSQQEVDRIAGAREQLNWSNLTDQAPTIQSLLEEPRFYGVAQQLLGEDAVGWDSNSNLYSGNRSPCPRPSPTSTPPHPPIRMGSDRPPPPEVPL